MVNTQGGAGHPPLEPSVADRLLELLSTDDGFRAKFQQDPSTALKQAGLSDAEAALSGTSCMRVSNLASKEEVQASREVLQNYLTSAGTHVVVYCFEADKVAASLRRK
ncbi:MAG: NHLP-related RiPP peptide [Lysobacter sp.]